MEVLAVLIAIAACAWLQGLLYRKHWKRKINLSLSFSEAYATEGDRLLLTEVVTNRKLLPLPWLAVKFQVSRNLLFDDRANARVSDDYYRNDLFNLPPYRRITRRLPFTCGKRGYYTVKSAELVSADILARERLATSASCAAVLTVYPRVVDIDAYLTAHKQFLGQILTKRFIQPDPFEFKGIREYQPYDSLRSVNFKATAHTGHWMVNIHDYTVTREIVLLLNMQPYNAFPDDALYEHTIRMAASLAAYYIGNAVPLSFVSNAITVRTAEVGSADENGIWLDSGAGQRHLTTVNEILARIDLPRGISMPGHVLLDEARRSQDVKRRTGREPAYVMLSPCHDKPFKEAFDALCETGADALWIIPLFKGTDLDIPLSGHIVKAEVAS